MNVKYMNQTVEIYYDKLKMYNGFVVPQET